jgi:hypothetical protein
MTLRHYAGYVSVDWERDGDDVEPLLWCLRFAVSDAFPFDYFLRGILLGDDDAPSGGDPGWVMYPERLKDGRKIYRAWTNPDMSYLDPCEGQYDEATAKRLVRRTLENYAKANPEFSSNVQEVIEKYGL